MEEITREEMIEFCLKAAECIGEYEDKEGLCALSAEDLQKRFEWYDYLLDK